MGRCCFTGHRAIPAEKSSALIEKLAATIDLLYTAGVREFYTGGARGFDTLAAMQVLAYRTAHPDVCLHLILPCRDQSKSWSAGEREVYERILTAADEVIVLFEHYCPECMHARNRALVDNSDICVAYLTHNRGGTLYTATYALKKGLRLYNLATDPLPTDLTAEQ